MNNFKANYNKILEVLKPITEKEHFLNAQRVDVILLLLKFLLLNRYMLCNSIQIPPRFDFPLF